MATIFKTLDKDLLISKISYRLNKHIHRKKNQPAHTLLIEVLLVVCINIVNSFHSSFYIPYLRIGSKCIYKRPTGDFNLDSSS